MMRGPQNNRAEELDEHDLPTEPIYVVSPFAPTVSSGASPEQDIVPAPRPYEQPFPQQQVQNPSPQQISQQPGVYPYLPPVPTSHQGNRPAGGVVPVQPETAGARPVQARRSRIPVSVGMFFVAVQFLLLIRFVLKIVNVPGSIPWVGAIYTTSSLFVLPFRLLLQQVTSPIPIPVELYTLLAILVYGLLSRVLVHLLKTFLNRS